MDGGGSDGREDGKIGHPGITHTHTHKACKMYGKRDSRGNVVYVVKTHKQREFEVFLLAARIHKPFILPKFVCTGSGAMSRT